MQASPTKNQTKPALLRQSIEPDKIAPRLKKRSDEDEPVAAVAPKKRGRPKNDDLAQAAKRNKKIRLRKSFRLF
jgi:hypothetical protein